METIARVFTKTAFYRCRTCKDERWYSAEGVNQQSVRLMYPKACAKCGATGVWGPFFQHELQRTLTAGKGSCRDVCQHSTSRVCKCACGGKRHGERLRDTMDG